MNGHKGTGGIVELIDEGEEKKFWEEIWGETTKI